jgi:GxxExxY protein
MVTAKLKRNDLIYPELSYQIVGCAYEVFKELGSGCLEKHYQRALKIALDNKSIKNTEQVSYQMNFGGKSIGKIILDFLVEDKVIVEIKKSDKFSETNINQVFNYLKATGLQLALIINFGRTEVKFRRIVNIQE